MVNNNIGSNFDGYLQLVFWAAQLQAILEYQLFVHIHRGFNQELCQEIRNINIILWWDCIHVYR